MCLSCLNCGNFVASTVPRFKMKYSLSVHPVTFFVMHNHSEFGEYNANGATSEYSQFLHSEVEMDSTKRDALP